MTTKKRLAAWLIAVATLLDNCSDRLNGIPARPVASAPEPPRCPYPGCRTPKMKHGALTGNYIVAGESAFFTMAANGVAHVHGWHMYDPAEDTLWKHFRRRLEVRRFRLRTGTRLRSPYPGRAKVRDNHLIDPATDDLVALSLHPRTTP